MTQEQVRVELELAKNRYYPDIEIINAAFSGLPPEKKPALRVIAQSREDIALVQAISPPALRVDFDFLYPPEKHLAKLESQMTAYTLSRRWKLYSFRIGIFFFFILSILALATQFVKIEKSTFLAGCYLLSSLGIESMLVAVFFYAKQNQIGNLAPGCLWYFSQGNTRKLSSQLKSLYLKLGIANIVKK